MKALVKKRITRSPCGTNANENTAQSALPRLSAARPQGRTLGLRIVRERTDQTAAVRLSPIRRPFTAAGRIHHLYGPRSVYTPAVCEFWLLNVASVASSVPEVLRTSMKSRSKTDAPAASFVEMLSQKFRFAPPLGIVTVW